MSARVCVVTAGHLSTCPRTLKAADALHGAGYQVRVVSTSHLAWAAAADRAVRATRPWAWHLVDYARQTARATQVLSGARFRAARKAAAIAGPERLPLAVAVRGHSRMHDELTRAVTREPADFVYGGTSGALAAVAAAAAALGVPYAVDLEDFHSGQHAGPRAALVHALAERVERAVFRLPAFLTTSSPMIAEAYARKYGVQPITVHNTFPLPASRASPPPAGALRLYWFSQKLGPGRGLEEVVRAVGRAGAPAELHLRARFDASYVGALEALQRDAAPRLALRHHDPAAPDAMVELAQPYDAGLACEEPSVLNRRLCLTNKIFTYLSAGIPVILSRTPAQARLGAELDDAALGYDCGDVDGLARVIRALAADAALRDRARAAARAAAARRWHWEHPDDRGALLGAVEGACR